MDIKLIKNMQLSLDEYTILSRIIAGLDKKKPINIQKLAFYYCNNLNISEHEITNIILQLVEKCYFLKRNNGYINYNVIRTSGNICIPANTNNTNVLQRTGVRNNCKSNNNNGLQKYKKIIGVNTISDNCLQMLVKTNFSKSMEYKGLHKYKIANSDNSHKPNNYNNLLQFKKIIGVNTLSTNGLQMLVTTNFNKSMGHNGLPKYKNFIRPNTNNANDLQELAKTNINNFICHKEIHEYKFAGFATTCNINMLQIVKNCIRINSNNANNLKKSSAYSSIKPMPCNKLQKYKNYFKGIYVFLLKIDGLKSLPVYEVRHEIKQLRYIEYLSKKNIYIYNNKNIYKKNMFNSNILNEEKEKKKCGKFQKPEIRLNDGTIYDPERGKRFANWFKKLLPESRQKKVTSHNLARWAKEYPEILNKTGMKPKEVAELIVWARRDKFWSTNFYSPLKLLKKSDNLDMKFYEAWIIARDNTAKLR